MHAADVELTIPQGANTVADEPSLLDRQAQALRLSDE